MERPVIDATLKVTQRGECWHEAHWIQYTTLDGPDPVYRVVAIEDGTGEMPPMMVFVAPDRPAGVVGEFGVVCNVRAPHRFMRFGAKCTIVNHNPGWAGEHMEVVGMTRGGRMTRTWIDARDLSNFRAAWVKSEEARYGTKEEAQARAEFYQERYGNTPMRDLRPPTP